MKASLYNVVNQNGDVVLLKICPSDALEHVVTSLENIWQSQLHGGTRMTTYITDNIHKDKREFIALYI